jgi:membrane protease YdiL (CAAX protease family)
MSFEHPLRAREVPAPAAIEERAASRRLLLLMLGLIVGWGLLMQRFGNAGNIYAVMGPFALSVLLAVVALASSKLVIWLRASRRAALSGLAVGLAMTLATYPTYALLRSFVPELEGQVAALYTAAHRTTLAEALPWVLAIIVAEEVLWRGALLYVLERRVPPALAMAISVATYAAAQFGTGSWIVMLLALVCGTLWTLQRHFTRSLLSPLLAHLIWTPTVILFYPVTSL